MHILLVYSIFVITFCRHIRETSERDPWKCSFWKYFITKVTNEDGRGKQSFTSKEWSRLGPPRPQDGLTEDCQKQAPSGLQLKVGVPTLVAACASRVALLLWCLTSFTLFFFFVVVFAFFFWEAFLQHRTECEWFVINDDDSVHSISSWKMTSN